MDADVVAATFGLLAVILLGNTLVRRRRTSEPSLRAGFLVMAVITVSVTVVMTWVSIGETGFGRVLSVATAVLSGVCAIMFIAAYAKAIKTGLK